MPWIQEQSVVNYGGHDYWRTWFIEECEASQLFGATERNLKLLTVSSGMYKSYQEGREIFLEDAPYFRATKTHHRVCGPYLVASSDLPAEAIPVHEVDGQVIVYKERHPQRGPWLDRSTVRRHADGVDMKLRQIASEFSFFPYRFAIRRSPKFKVELVPHSDGCWLCV